MARCLQLARLCTLDDRSDSDHPSRPRTRTGLVEAIWAAARAPRSTRAADTLATVTESSRDRATCRTGSTGPLAHHRWWAVAVAGLVLFAVACDDGDGDSASTSPQGTNATPTVSIGETEGTPEGVDAFDGERYRTDGLTFVYPTEVYSSAAEQPSSGATDAVAVDLATSSGGREGTVVVTMVRSAEGLESGELGDEDRALLSRLESLEPKDSIESQGEPEVEVEVERFVNGVGVNSLDGEVYRYQGVTDDGRFLVEITGHGQDRAALERIVGSLFVDGAAARFAGEACEEAVELVNENGVPEGETVGPGEEVTATWEVRNVGSCTWRGDHAWVYTGGEPVAIIGTTVSPAEVAPNEFAQMTVTFLAPEAPGRYAAQWQLQPPRSLTAVAPAAFALFEVAS